VLLQAQEKALRRAGGLFLVTEWSGGKIITLAGLPGSMDRLLGESRMEGGRHASP
jgi:hypothetical protein